MANVAVHGSFPSTSLEIGGGALKLGNRVRRKTPSELRGEQLKRTCHVELDGESSSPSIDSKSVMDSGLKKPELSRNPRYVDTRMDEVYPVKRSRFHMVSGKESAKESSLTEQSCILKNISVPSDLAADRGEQLSREEKSSSFAEVSEDGGVQASQTTDNGIKNKFRTVSELSSAGDRSSGLASIDMHKALKGLAAHQISSTSVLPEDSSERFNNSSSNYSGNISSECHIPGQKAPLDFTLKTTMRVVTTSINRVFNYGTMPQLPFQFGCRDQFTSCNSVPTSGSQLMNSELLHSWVYPQSTLPPSVFTILTSSAAQGVEIDFFGRRQLDWEESFRSLYYVLRNNICDIFYVCTSHYVVMFTGSGGSRGSKRLCNAYISRSTRGLRSLLSEHGISFSMPLCRSKVEQVTTEDLFELSEIEKHNLGQTRRLKSASDVDNSPQSLLLFSGNKSVQMLYDLLLNYRSFLTSLTGVDVPVLYSPVPFRNAALSSPQVKCMEMRSADHIGAPKGCFLKDDESMRPSSGVCYSIEIKDAYIPPWIICGMCAILGSEGRNFEASFITEPTSIGLHAALGSVSEKSDSPAIAGEGLPENCRAFGIPEATLSPHLRSGSLKRLKCCNGSYTASIAPI